MRSSITDRVLIWGTDWFYFYWANSIHISIECHHPTNTFIIPREGEILIQLNRMTLVLLLSTYRNLSTFMHIYVILELYLSLRRLPCYLKSFFVVHFYTINVFFNSKKYFIYFLLTWAVKYIRHLFSFVEYKCCFPGSWNLPGKTFLPFTHHLTANSHQTVCCCRKGTGMIKNYTLVGCGF